VPRRFSKRRTLVIAAITVALSVGIVFASVPYLPHSVARHGSIKLPVSHIVLAGTVTHPGFASLSLPGVSNNESFAVGVTVIGGSADFCPIEDATYQGWVASYYTTSNPGSTFPSGSCVPQEQMGIVQGVISWSPTSSGTWDVAALNTSPQNVTVTFSPA
jgi:hypothetical protein